MSRVVPHGYVERLSRDAVFGWAYDAASPAVPVEVELVLDGAVVSAAPAATGREDLAALGIGRDTCGFELSIPAGTPIDLHRLEIRVAGASHPLPVAEEAGIHEGVIEQVEDFTVSGWAWRVGGTDPVRLLLRHGNDDLAEFTADTFRDDLQQAGFGTGAHGFSFSFRQFSRGHINPRNISVLFKATGERLFDLRAHAPAPVRAADPAAPLRTRPRPVLGAHRRARLAQAAAEAQAAPPAMPRPDALAEAMSAAQAARSSYSDETMRAMSEALNLGEDEAER